MNSMTLVSNSWHGKFDSLSLFTQLLNSLKLNGRLISKGQQPLNHLALDKKNLDPSENISQGLVIVFDAKGQMVLLR